MFYPVRDELDLTLLYCIFCLLFVAIRGIRRAEHVPVASRVPADGRRFERRKRRLFCSDVCRLVPLSVVAKFHQYLYPLGVLTDVHFCLFLFRQVTHSRDTHAQTCPRATQESADDRPFYLRRFRESCLSPGISCNLPLHFLFFDFCDEL